MSKEYSKLSRKINPMPGYVEYALEDRDSLESFYDRPLYQQNDYSGWIERAKRKKTKENRLAQMLFELETGGVYMNMDHPASSRK